ncbi:uncharacterized protein LOC131234608 [Magnolia sinica]|uniref:uncharacterized protein LOC131234608 n=1 Tax=Magnolia sinica TaxID=86752 RepID=UPI0026585B56|nr:uncharacterized protein LOC131234608 [Magnolia sinica]
MDPMGEEQLDYEDDEYGGSQKLQFQGSGAISALADEELMGENDEYDDLYNDVNVGEGFMDIIQEQITRVLLERLIVNQPHPWGLLITFINLQCSKKMEVVVVNFFSSCFPLNTASS